jgi:hypothetical protein
MGKSTISMAMASIVMLVVTRPGNKPQSINLLDPDDVSESIYKTN